MPSPAPRPEGPTLKKLLILGTGGTIAGVGAAPGSPVGYRAGALPIGQLLESVPGLAALGELHAEQVFSIPSEQMDGAHWLQLATRLRQVLATPGAVDAVVVTHGTDTMEETAFFLSLLLPAHLPVILTGAMRPSTALDADGPGNLYRACRFALAAAEQGIGGTFVAFGDAVFNPDAVCKRHANTVLAFGARHGQPVAWMESDRPVWRQPDEGLQAALARLPLPAGGPAPATSEAAEGQPGTASGMSATAGAASPLPPVAVVQQHVDGEPALVHWLVSRGYRGIVLAGTGIGTMPAPMRAALAEARRQGCLVVRASRVAQGFVGRNTEADPADSDEALDFITAGWLDPLKARILLQLCLLAGDTDTQAIQALFDRCGP